MRRLSGILVAGAMLVLPAFATSAAAQDAGAGAPPAQQGQPQQPAAPKTTYAADAVIVMYAVNPGKDADYEQVIAKLRDALAKSTAPEAKQQAAGWTVFKSDKSLTNDTSSTYIHIISPVVKDADYSIVNIVYAASTDDEKRAFYDLYKGALKGALSQISGGAVSTSPGAAAPAGGQ